MQIDLFTYIAQLLNFALLVFLLRRFLYQPIIAVMAAREAEIAAHFQKAETERVQAQQEAALFHDKRVALEAARETLVAEAQQEAAEQRSAMMLTARAEVDELQQGWLAAIQETQLGMQQKLREQMIQQVFQMSRHLLTELADVALEEKIVMQFIKQLYALGDDERAKLQRSLATAQHKAVIRSAFPLATEQRHQIDQALHQVLGDDDKDAQSIRTRYTRSPELVAGIELRLHDYQLTWNIRDELKSLDAELDDLFEQKDLDVKTI